MVTCFRRQHRFAGEGSGGAADDSDGSGSPRSSSSSSKAGLSRATPGGMQPAGAPSMGVYQWQDVPQGQQVPVNRATFDQGGYKVYAASGETIVVPFANQNLYAMKFGRSYTGQAYFVNEGDAPV